MSSSLSIIKSILWVQVPHGQRVLQAHQDQDERHRCSGELPPVLRLYARPRGVSERKVGSFKHFLSFEIILFVVKHLNGRRSKGKDETTEIVPRFIGGG